MSPTTFLMLAEMRSRELQAEARQDALVRLAAGARPARGRPLADAARALGRAWPRLHRARPEPVVLCCA